MGDPLSTYTPDPRIQPYLDHLEREGPGIPYVSTSQDTLHRISCEHGAATVESLLRTHWDTMRVIQEHR